MRLSSKSARARLFIGASALVLATTAGMARAQDRDPITIAPQSLTTALQQFGSQTTRQVMFSPDLVDSKKTAGVSAATDEQVALAQLLQGTGLSYRREGDIYLIVSASDPQSGSAAGDGAEGTVAALVVTAQKREENIQDVPIAMSAFTQEALERSQVAGGPDLMTQVPNMTFTKTNFTTYSIQLRGIGTQAISATTDNAVAVAFNNTPFIRNRFFEQEFYDLQRVEVLRGPQGTLYGRNATAGVVNLISQKPKFTYEAKASADISNYSSRRIEGMVNVPLVDDKVALRIAGAWTKREGYATNEITGNPIDGRNLWSTRASLRFTPTDRLDANLIWEHFQEDDDRLRSGKQLCHTHEVTEVGGIPVNHLTGLADYGQANGGPVSGGLAFSGVQGTLSQGCAPASLYSPDSFQVPNGLSIPYYGPLSAQALPAALTDPYQSTTQSHDLRVIESTVDPRYIAKTDVVELQFNYDLTDYLSLTSESAYMVDRIFSTQDFNRFNTQHGAFNPTGIWLTSGIFSPDGTFCDPQIGCADRLVGIDVSTARTRTFSQEFRLASNSNGPLNFSLGMNFLRNDTIDKYYVFFNTLTIYSASTQFGIGGQALNPWVPGVTDNIPCLKHGMRLPDTNSFETIGGGGDSGCIYIDPNPITALNDLGHNYFLSKNPYKLISYAAFGELYYQIAENLKLTAGLRWTVDKKEAPRIPSWVLGSDYVGYSVAEVVEQKWNEPTGRLAIDWKPHLSFTDETLLYVSYAHGYKAGGMNPPAAGVVIRGSAQPNSTFATYVANNATHPKTFEPEYVNALELGAKNTMLDGKLTLNLASFYYDYKAYQISQIVNRSAVNLNFDADVWGLELEGDWRPRENLRLGLKLGYENTKVADGERAIDTMDRTAGDPNWVTVSPFPTQPSNCILPTWLFIGHTPAMPGNPNLVGVGGQSGGNPGGCEVAYILFQDPVTGAGFLPYPYRLPGQQLSEQFRTNTNYAGWSTREEDYPCWPAAAGTPGTGNEYPGVDPLCLAALSNGGVGFFKNLSGNELPNAPHITATITADYTLPLPNSWLATLHTDLYYQSEAWTRIFNTAGYDKLKAYTNVNLAAIFTNEDLGWKVMAYVKNVFDRDSITGAFLNSDDTSLTTNVFLTEPRLYGLRVTKEWTGGPWWTGANPNHIGPYPLTVEISGQVQRQDAPYANIRPTLFQDFPDWFEPTRAQNQDLDWGDGRELKLTYQPNGSPWKVAASVRYGRTNSATSRTHASVTDEVGSCWVPINSTFGQAGCNPDFSYNNKPPGFYYQTSFVRRGTSWADSSADSREDHAIVDFGVGYDVGIGLLGDVNSTVSFGVKYAHLHSATDVFMGGNPNFHYADGWNFKYSNYTRYRANLEASREFTGTGPVFSWGAALPFLGNDEAGRVNVDWSVTGGVLFGKQKTQISGQGVSRYYRDKGQTSQIDYVGPLVTTDLAEPLRSTSVEVPVVDLSLGLSYEIQRVKVGAGYRWERYFNALDVGYTEREKRDRTFDGPYFKLSVGFGG